MSERVTVELPDELARRARDAAAARNRRLEDAVIEWIGQAVAEPTIEALSDDELLTYCDMTLEADLQEELSKRLSDIRESQIDASGRARLDHLMVLYRRRLMRKARAWKEAVARGLRSPLGGADTGAASDPGADHAA